MIVRVAPPEHHAWIAQRAQLVVDGNFRAIEAVDAEGRIHGMVGYDAWTANSCAMHIALKSPAALRHLLHPAFQIPFVHFGKGCVVALVLSTNSRSMDLVRHAGFIEVGRIRDGWDVGVDQVIFQMRRDECRYLEQAKEAA